MKNDITLKDLIISNNLISLLLKFEFMIRLSSIDKICIRIKVLFALLVFKNVTKKIDLMYNDLEINFLSLVRKSLFKKKQKFVVFNFYLSNHSC